MIALAAIMIALPNPTLTPGKSSNATKAEVCRKGYTKDVRFVSQETKRKVFERYGIPYSQHREYEVDHFISLELGGANDIENLWPEKYCPVGNKPLITGCWGAREKDVSETCLHKVMCAPGSKITTAQVQAAIKSDWISVYKKVKTSKCDQGILN